MEPIAGFSERNAEFILDQAMSYAKDRGVRPPDDLQFNRKPTHFYNDTGHEIPPYGVLQVKTVRDVATTFHDVKRPYDYDACQTTMLINGPYAVAVGERGTAQDGPVYRVIHDGGTYAVGDRLGWKTDSFQVTLGALLVNLGADMVTENCLRVAFDYSSIRGVTTSIIAIGGSGTFYRRKRTSGGFTTDTSRTYTAFNDSTTAIPNSADIKAWSCEGVWYAVEICE
jgi:hypothetical protein